MVVVVVVVVGCWLLPSIKHALPTRISKLGAEIFWELFFLFWELFFFYGFNWRWRRFRWGWAVPAEEVGLKKKQLEGGWGGGRGASPPDAFAEHAA